MKKKIVLIIVPIAAIIILLFLLLIDRSGNGFSRKIVDVHPQFKDQIALQNRTSLACNTDQGIWIQQREDPFTILILNDSLKRQVSYKIQLPKLFNSSRRNYYYSQIDSTTFISNEAGQIARLGQFKSDLFKIGGLKFDLSVSKSTNTIFVRSFVGTQHARHLEISKIVLSDSARVQKSFILPKQVDGVFCVDGKLNYDRKNARIYYMYYYRGEFICLDTNLNLLYKAKTIDTMRMAKIETKTYQEPSDKGILLTKKTVTAASKLVNSYFTVSSNKIYIKSDLMAENQTSTEFSHSSSIDVYSTDRGGYLYSFNIPNYNGNKLYEFSVKGNNLCALYHGRMIRYNFK